MVWVLRLLGVVLVVAVALPLGFRLAAAARESASLADVLPDEGRLIRTTDGAIFVLEVGPPDGPPLLFAHGTGAWSGLWRPVLEDMAAAGYRAIAFDLPPFGFSERDPEGAYGRVRQAERIGALVAALDITPVLVAHSFGAGPGMEAVLRNPDLFAGAIIVDGALGVGSHESDAALPLPLRPRSLREAIVATTATNPLLTRILLKPLVHRKEAATDAVVDVLQRPMVRSGSTAAFAAWLPDLLVPPQDARSTRAEAYAALDLPVVYLWGDRDTVTPLEQGQELAALSSQARLVVLADVGHIPQIEDQAGFVAALKTALDGLSGR
ncbi:alpha/beta fold hydrolase [Thalassococcus sp. BH17M4-6]|uniref:alpha/beta fold hydrolase n=1 Tax=Thalassococcus sp. BH17M4-6 TaxID=3413148 RepID=UPI003BE1E1B7